MEEKFKIATGKSTGATYGFLGSALKFAIKELGIMLNWFRDQGLQADITELKKIHPDMMDLETWLKTKSNFVKR
ncbi:uncharacterized protein L201_004346 [Kwoniella dendrophila CBS 6074]|uniref:Uncharacterized protein n=1 Tax=Kwoniella dendrophila CBS 6074 TaxID=1295534 RepID=A0AAX4JVN1_9TREE